MSAAPAPVLEDMDAAEDTHLVTGEREKRREEERGARAAAAPPPRSVTPTHPLPLPSACFWFVPVNQA